MKFSIIIPAYHAEKTLGACLQSLREQTFRDFEAIVIDDGSTDGTPLAAERFTRSDPRFRYIRQENRGVSAARNHGVEAASGEFILFLDSDDRYDPAYLQEFHEMTTAYPDCGHFWCGFRSVDPSGRDLGCTAWTGEGTGCQLLHRDRIMDLHEKTLDAALWNKAFRRQVLLDHGLRMDESLSLGEDLLFNFGYLDVCDPRIVVSSRPLYLYTKAADGTLDSKFRPDLKEIYEIVNTRLLDYLRRWEVSPAQMTKYYNSVFYTLERVLYNTYRPECAMTPAEKRKFNSAILKSSHFRQTFRQTDCAIHPLYRRAYALGSWACVRMLDALVDLKKKLGACRRKNHEAGKKSN